MSLTSRTIRLADDLADRTVLPGYSRLGFAARRHLLRFDEDPLELAGRRVLVTGASSGIGEAACVQLVQAGATVHMAVRSVERGEAARERIAAAAGGDSFELLTVERLDVSDLDDVARFASEFSGRAPELHGLIHNAGVLTDRREFTAQGHELTFATAVLGPFALTRALRPALGRGAAPVVFVSSGGMYTAELEVGDLELDGPDFNGPRLYAHAKRAQVVLASEFARRWSGTGVGFASCHPGWVDTPGLARSLPRFRRFLKPLLREPAAGADTATWLVGTDAAHREPGAFWHDRRQRPLDRVGRTATAPEDADLLWRRLTSMVAQARVEEALSF